MPTKKQSVCELLEPYTFSLKSYLGGGGEAALVRAYELGRRALGGGLSVAEMATIHHDALETIHGVAPDTLASRRRRDDVNQFFLEFLSPLEMVHRRFREANVALRQLNEAMEKEARRIAHALHDEAGSLLVSVHIALEALSRDLPQVDRRKLSQVRELLDRMEEQLRRLSHELRPTILDDLGLGPALRFLAEGISTRTGVAIDVECEEGRLPNPVETALYRIVQEALTNVGKHARAKCAHVRLQRKPGSVVGTVEDDGRGFEPRAGDNGHGLGLVGIRERLDALGGNLEIVSVPGRGTRLDITIPVEGGS